MTRRYERWIFTKSCDFTPQGSLQLGRILASPFEPGHALQPSGPLPLHRDILVETTSRQNIDIQSNDEILAQFGAWASIGRLPAGFKIDASTQTSHESVWHFDRLESKIMAPSIAYVKAAMRHGDVPSNLKKWSFKKRVYMITGVRAVSGGRMKRSNEASHNIDASVQVTPHASSLAAEAKAAIATIASDSENFDNASTFVFAYRLNEIRYRGKVTHKPFTPGETSSAESYILRTEGGVSIDDFEVIKLSDVSFEGDSSDSVRVEVPGYELECFVGVD